MTTFSNRTRNAAVVPAARLAIWDLLADPDSLASLTPLVTGIDAAGDRWTWHLAGIRALGVCVAPSFTELMTFDHGRHIGFRHDRAAGGEQAAVEGGYWLADVDGGTELRIDLTMSVELPLPRLARGAVEKVMAATMARTGTRFARTLYERLGLDPALAMADATPITA